jgi:hypothetical protein
MVCIETERFRIGQQQQKKQCSCNKAAAAAKKYKINNEFIVKMAVRCEANKTIKKGQST